MALDPGGPEVITPRPKVDRSIATLLSDLASETMLLFRQELALVRAELHEKVSRAGQGAGALGAGALIAYSGWLAIVAAMILALTIVWPAWLAAVVVGAVIVVIGIVLMLIGRSRLNTEKLKPTRTLRTLREDEAWLKERLR